VIKLRVFRKHLPRLDQFDPTVMWVPIEVLQIWNENHWEDVPLVVEKREELTDAIKRDRLPVEEHWRLDTGKY
jgi:hypothetical protein